MQIGVCDDEKEILEAILGKIKKLYPEEDLISFGSGLEILAALRLPDILFLDIQMPGMNGLETAKRLRQRSRRMIIIFVTVTEDYVFQSFDVGAFHYLVKPFDDTKFQEVLNGAVRQHQEITAESSNAKKNLPSLVITAKGQHLTVPLEEIVYAEVFNRKIIVHTADTDIEYYGKMKDLEKMAGDDFYRPHRAYLINFNYVRRYDATAIYLIRGQAFMAKQNYPDFVKAFLKFNQRKGRG